EEERYIKVKHTREFPANAIADCLRIAGLKIDDLDRVAFCYKPDLLLGYDGPVRKMRRDLPTEEEFTVTLLEKNGYSGPVDFHEHHICHLASTYYPSGFQDALLMSNDGVGEILCSMLAKGSEGTIEPLFAENDWPDSLGLLYSAVTFYLGWKPMYDEGITMGLAPLGDSSKFVPNSDKTYLEVFREIIVPSNKYGVKINTEWIAFHQERSKFVGDKFISTFGPKKEWAAPITENHQNIAAALQDRLEEIVLEQLRSARTEFGLSKLCIAGGVGLNCSLNGKIAQSKIFDEIFVQPGAGDNGTAIGACYLSQRIIDDTLCPSQHHHFYLGTSETNKNIQKYLDSAGLTYFRLNGDFEPVAQKLTERQIVGWFQGPAEFGPRALGNRSILTAPFPADIKDHINARVKFREPFRPFAPAVMSEFASEYFHIEQESPHMLMAVQVRPEKRDSIPAVIHVDGSARVQTVSSENNRKFRALLELFYGKTGCPVLLNTSFNVKGQPIVNDIHDAVQCYLRTNIDVLVAGDFMVVKE
ncbi:MAG TPA: carbamoyl transferase, partial [Flavobacteriaceae bacterium]|nr:carbamoyl transferase [Flavobacteriaceae bacterium]